MDIEVVAKKEIGEKYKAIVYSVELDDGDYGEQIKVGLLESPSANKAFKWLPIPATERNRTGRTFTNMNGTYPTGTYDPSKWEGLPVSMIYAQKKGGEPGDLVLDLIKPRDAGKGENPVEVANVAAAQDDLEAPF